MGERWGLTKWGATRGESLAAEWAGPTAAVKVARSGGERAAHWAAAMAGAMAGSTAVVKADLTADL